MMWKQVRATQKLVLFGAPSSPSCPMTSSRSSFRHFWPRTFPHCGHRLLSSNSVVHWFICFRTPIQGTLCICSLFFFFYLFLTVNIKKRRRIPFRALFILYLLNILKCDHLGCHPSDVSFYTSALLISCVDIICLPIFFRDLFFDLFWMV